MNRMLFADDARVTISGLKQTAMTCVRHWKEARTFGRQMQQSPYQAVTAGFAGWQGEKRNYVCAPHGIADEGFARAQKEKGLPEKSFEKHQGVW